MIAEPFAHRQSWMHTLDPRVRVCAAFFLSSLFAITNQQEQAIYALIASALLLGLSKPPLRALLHRLAAVNLFILFLWCSVPFFTPGTAIATFGPLTCTEEGLTLAWLVSIKANAITLLLITCIATMPASLLGQALQALHLPDKLVYLLLFTYRSIFVLADEWQRLQTALRLRGFVPATNLHTYRTVGYLFGLTLTRSLDRSQRVHQAMLLRGFTGRFLPLVLLRFTRQDLVFTLLLLLFIVFFLLIGKYHIYLPLP